jgi:PKD repeat protein
VARFAAAERVPSQWAFDASSSSDDVGIVSYQWGFGSGVGGESGVVSAASFPPGEHTVTLTVTDTAGQVHSSSQVINVGGG